MARNEDEEQVQDMLRNGLLIKRRVQDGRGVFPFDCPRYDSLLQVHYKGMLLNDEKTVFYDTRVNNDGRPLEFSVGAVPIGFEICVWSMLPGEIAFVTCAPVYAYDTFPRPARVPEGAHVQWEIELLGFESPKNAGLLPPLRVKNPFQDWTGFNFRSIMDEADKIKFTGNRLFKEGKFELAREKYEKVLREFNHVYPWDDEEGKEFSNARNLLHLNVAACFLKMGECRKSIEACNKVLDANPVHVKAFYRRGMAYMQAGDFDEARSDFQKMTSIDKSSEPEAAVALLKLKQKEQEVEKKARKQFKGLFDKKPGIIADAEIPGTSSRSESDNQNEDDDFSSNGDQAEEQHEATNPPPRMGSFSLWPIGDRVVDALELDRCTIL